MVNVIGDAYGTGIVQKMSEHELEESANQKKLSSVPLPNKGANEEV